MWLILDANLSERSNPPSLQAGPLQSNFLFSWPVAYFFMNYQLSIMIGKHLHYTIITASKLINPYTHSHLPVKPYIEESSLYEKIAQASTDLRAWKKVPVDYRREGVTKLVEKVISDKEELKPLISAFTGKSYKNIDEEFKRLQKVSKKLIMDSKKALAERTFETQYNGQKVINKVIFEPVGVTAIFPFFSQPVFDALIHLIPCLISGNSAILKVSDYNNFLGEYLHQAAVSTLGYEGLVSDTFIHPTSLHVFRDFRPIKKIIYSGSQSSARRIFEQLVINRFIDCNLFYGGQDAAFVDSDADLQLAARQICSGAFYNNGQSYDCIKRLYLHQDIQSQFIGILSEKISQLVLGDPTNPETDLGPIAIPQQVLRFEQLINDAINFDAQCIIGGLVVSDGKQKGMFCEPTLLHNCHSSMQIVQEQLHAPVLCSSTISSFEEFVTEAEQNSYGTGVRIFAKQPKKYLKGLERLEVGFISFNSANITDSDLPIEGWKHSGKGKMLSELSYQEYTVPKSYVLHKLSE